MNEKKMKMQLKDMLREHQESIWQKSSSKKGFRGQSYKINLVLKRIKRS
jgi:hypothetical protein